MDDNDDFTFCKVNGPVNVDVFEAQKVVPDVGGINLNDEPSECVEADKSIGVLSRNGVVTSTSPKEETVGTLTFSVVSASSSKQSSDSAKEAASQNKESSPRELQEPNTIVKKPKPRAKVPFEKGYSQMDWLKLTRTHPDLAGLNGQSNQRLISLSEVKLHKTEDSMWTVLKGRVYNITPYMKFHPGGVDFLMKAVGKDCTALFNKYHAWVNAEFLLEKCLVGILDDSQ